MIKELINFPILISEPPKHSTHVLWPSLPLKAIRKQQKFVGSLSYCLTFIPLFFERKAIIFSFILFFMKFSKLTYFGFTLAKPGQRFLVLFGAPGVYS